jgi:hypothetical protein
MFFHLLNALLVGVTKLEAFQWYKVTKLNPSKPSPLFVKCISVHTYTLVQATVLLSFFQTWDHKNPAVACVPY